MNNELTGLTKLIMSQDIIEGYWKENNQNKKIIQIVSKDIFNIVENKIKELNKEKEEMKKIIYTILVIYLLNTKYTEQLNDYRLIINKGKNI